MKKTRVFLGTCPDYELDTITRVLEKGVAEIGFDRKLEGNIVIKPNLVMAHPRVATDGYTRVEVVEAILRWILGQNGSPKNINIVEKSGLGVTTASMFRWAGYRRLKKAYGVHLRPMEEGRKSVVVLTQGKVHRHLTVASDLKHRHCLIFAPKLKTNVLSQAFTGALKLNIGNIDSKERIDRHHHQLPAKIVDILEVANPDLIVADGIRFSYGGNQMTQPGHQMGVITVATNAVAHDMVCAKLIGLDPFKIDHIREAMDRGYGPTSFSDVEVIGDFPLDRGHQIVKNLDFGFYPVDTFESPFRILSGTPYCIGGCHGIFLDWLHMIKDRKPELRMRFPRLTVLIGKMKQTVEDRTVLLVGNCANTSPSVQARRVVRIRGCPPTHKRIVWEMMVRFLLLSPLVRPSLIVDGFILYPLKKLKGWLTNLRLYSR